MAATRRKPLRRGKTAGRTVKAPALSRESIARAALRLIDRHGIEAFSTRKLGAELRCEAMTIYYYYPSKDVLLDAVVEEMVAPLGRVAVEPAGDWVDALRRVAHAYRGLARAHPRAFPLLATRRFASGGTYAFLEELFALARRHGIPDRTAAHVYRAVSSYCNGFALNELATAREDEDPSLAALRAGYPHVDAVFAWLGPAHADENFAAGLDLLLGHLASGGSR